MQALLKSMTVTFYYDYSLHDSCENKLMKTVVSFLAYLLELSCVMMHAQPTSVINYSY